MPDTLAPEGVAYTDDQIRALTEFQERFFRSVILRSDAPHGSDKAAEGTG